MEALHHKTSEAEHLRERVTTLELTVSSETEEKSQYEVNNQLKSVIIKNRKLYLNSNFMFKGQVGEAKAVYK